MESSCSFGRLHQIGQLEKNLLGNAVSQSAAQAKAWHGSCSSPFAEPGAAQAATFRQPGLGGRMGGVGRCGRGDQQISAWPRLSEAIPLYLIY